MSPVLLFDIVNAQKFIVCPCCRRFSPYNVSIELFCYVVIFISIYLWQRQLYFLLKAN